MGSHQSRVEQDGTTAGDSDNWMSRVEVKPTQELLARLQQQQIYQSRATESNNRGAGHSVPEDNQSEQERVSEQAAGGEDEAGRSARKEEVRADCYGTIAAG